MYDVIVIGAGPAGSIASKIIASKGFSVTQIDKKKKIGIPVQCAEAITEYALKNVELPTNEKWIKQKVKGVKILLPDNQCFYSKAPGISIDRSLFDKWISNMAIDKGTHLKLDTIMKKINKKNEKWEVITNKDTYRSKIIIGADGANSKTARLLYLLNHREYIKAIQYKFDKKDIDFNVTDWLCMTMSEKFRIGYGWIFPRGDEFNIGIGSLNGNKQILNNYCKSMNFDINKKKDINAGLIPYNFILKTRTTEDGAVIIGDAAGMTNPATGGGIHAALYSGKKAGETIVNALENEDFQILKKYDKHIKKTIFLNPIHRKTVNYFKNWKHNDWKFFGNAANGLEMSDLTLSKCFLIGIKNPKYFLRANELLTIRKEMKINQKYGW